MKWIITKRRLNDYVIHQVNDLRGICVCHTSIGARRVADALNHSNEKGENTK